MCDLLALSRDGAGARAIALPLLLAALSTWPQALGCPGPGSAPASAPGSTAPPHSKGKAGKTATTAVGGGSHDIVPAVVDPLGSALLAGVADLCDAFEDGSETGSSGSSDNESNISREQDQEEEDDLQHPQGRHATRQRSRTSTAHAPSLSLSLTLSSLGSAPSDSSSHAATKLLRRLAACLARQVAPVCIAVLGPSLGPQATGSDAGEQAAGAGGLQQVRWARVCVKALAVVRRAVGELTADPADFEGANTTAGGVPQSQPCALLAQAQAALRMATNSVPGWPFLYEHCVRVLLSWVPELGSAPRAHTLCVLADLVHGQRVRAGGGVQPVLLALSPGAVNALLGVCERLGSLLAPGCPLSTGMPNVQAAAAVALTRCAGLAVGVANERKARGQRVGQDSGKSHPVPEGDTTAALLHASLAPVMQALHTWAAAPPLDLALLPMDVCATLRGFAASMPARHPDCVTQRQSAAVADYLADALHNKCKEHNEGCSENGGSGVATSGEGGDQVGGENVNGSLDEDVSVPHLGALLKGSKPQKGDAGLSGDEDEAAWDGEPLIARGADAGYHVEIQGHDAMIEEI